MMIFNRTYQARSPVTARPGTPKPLEAFVTGASGVRGRSAVSAPRAAYQELLEAVGSGTSTGQARSALSTPPIRPKPLPEALTSGGATFDYIVIGAGAAGCALIDRILTGIADATVLLLEAGPTNEVPQIQDFTQAMSLRRSVYDWGDDSEPQTCMNGGVVPYHSGHVNGGGTSINGMVWARGHPGDYDNWAATGCTGWDYHSILPVFEREETYSGAGAGPTRGTNGPVKVTNRLSINNVSQDFVNAMIALGYRYNPDYNAGSQDGVTFTQLNVEPASAPLYGTRQDAFKAFVAPHLANPRLTTANDTQVQRVTFDNQGNAQQVWFAHDGQSYSVAVTKDIIVCAGTLRTPQILMLSGIGDPDRLRTLGIPVVFPQPAVGQDLQDHIVPFVVWSMKQADPDHYTAMDNNVFVGDDGPLGSPTYQIQTFYMKGNPGFPSNTFAVGAIVLHPQSRGEVTLKSSNVSDRPVIQPNLLCKSADLSVALAGLKLARVIAQEFAARTQWLDAELMPGPHAITDEEMIDYIKQQAVPDFHYVGTCKMGVNGQAVVDPTCRVYGVNGLRVADASVMPFVTSGNTNAPAMMIGGRCGDFIISGIPSP